MKLALFASLLILLGVPGQSDDLATAIDKSNFVAFLYYEDAATSVDPVYKGVEVFKGNHYYLIDRNGVISKTDDQLYLVVGNVDGASLSYLN